ncbi:MAG TPA: acyl-CoA dehydrogenase [Gallionellaceae bacterium]|nr:acyl-CoA dehydrogenase [Gallionellaceae bacterium]
MEWLMAAAVIAVILLLAFYRASVLSWVAALVVLVPLAGIVYSISADAMGVVLLLTMLLAMLLGLPFLRRSLVSYPVLVIFRRILPQLSPTEQEALDAGTVWWEGELFNGMPDWNKLIHLPKPALSTDEELFLAREVEQLCAMVDDWDVTHVRQDLSPEAWQFLKEKGFFGMIIPKEYGGLGFSALAHSAVVTKLASRSATLAVTAMVPNSLGPAELLLHYGTRAQKEYYLPRLAKGEEIPCFALTGPFAGSDAGAIPDFGIVCQGEFNGQRVLGIRLTWEKRYITLAPVATLLGLAFKLYDPDHLAGGETERGITLALIPTDTPGVVTGRRHFPLNSAFLNGPTQGHDVFIPMDFVIGGFARVGEGWRMLMECLSAGRGISLPSSATGAGKLAARASGAYARVRKQFKLPIGKFEGVEEPLARIGGHLYMMDAARLMTTVGIDLGEKPSVVSAIVKYHCTERGRIIANDAMDVHGGKGICLGPSNYLGRGYQQVPIGITVEGANILTRSMIIFGQGAIRAHPYVIREIRAAHDTSNKERAQQEFDDAFFSHVGFVASNAVRALVFGLTNGRFIPVPLVANERYYQKLTRYATAFALLADASLLILGGSLKRREKISARLGDILSQLYLCSATLKRFEDDGRCEADLPLFQWAMDDAIFRIEEAFDGVLRNFPNRMAALGLRVLIFPKGRRARPPSDLLGHQVTALLMQPGETRDRLTAGMYLPQGSDDPVAALELALHSTLECEPLQARVEAARKARGSSRVRGMTELERIADAQEKGVLQQEEALLLECDYDLRRKVVMVDDFAPEELPAGARRGHG